MFAAKKNNRQDAIFAIIADTLALPIESITFDLQYQSVNAWDSMAHVNLMLALEKNFAIRIDQHKVLELTSVKNIVDFLQGTPTQKETLTQHIHRGLNNIYYDYTKVAHIDAEQGKLYYRGYLIDELIANATFNEVIYLLLFGQLPTRSELKNLDEILIRERSLPTEIVAFIHHTAQEKTVDVLRTACSLLANAVSIRKHNATEQCLAWIAKAPLIVGTLHAHQQNKRLDLPDTTSHAEYVLRMFSTKKIDALNLKLFEKIMIIQAEHDSNASAFVARIAMSTQTSIGECLTAAIATFTGDLHGGALLSVMTMLEEIGSLENVEPYLQHRIENGLPIFGFGHRVYRTIDPRATPLKKAAHLLSVKYNEPKWLALLNAIEKYMTQYIAHGMNINVDYYACVALKLLGLRREDFIPLFIANRFSGWCAHIIEQKENNILLRPRLHYKGDLHRPYIPLAQRESL